MHFPTPKEIRQQIPLAENRALQIAEHRKIICNLISGKESRIAIVAGPCSIHDFNSAVEYALRFKALAKKVEKNCFLVMRVHIEKPRSALGWKGFLYDPHLDGSHNISQGLSLCRKLLLTLVHHEIPIATEFLDPLASSYFEDLVSWGFVGARTSASQTHRQLASLLTMPIGFKNSTDGNLENAINGVMTARAPHAFLFMNQEGRLCEQHSHGNSSAHIVLRGSQESPNYDPLSVQQALHKLNRNHILARILIDCSHGNCQKQYQKQRDVFESVLEQFIQGNARIMGAMLESHLEAGNQMLLEDTSSLLPSISITDPCIDWSTTEELIGSADELLSTSGLSSSFRS